MNFTGVAEMNTDGEVKFAIVAGLDIGVGTPGQALTNTGAEATIGLRASFGDAKNKEGVDFSLLSIALVANTKAEVIGVGIKLEFRHQLVNFDTANGRPEFTGLNPNGTKIGVGSERTLMTSPIKIKAGGGARLNGL